MFGSKVASTREIIEKLQKYEKQNGIGSVKGIAIICDGDRETEYIFRIANDSDSNRIFTKDGKYKETEIRISSILDDRLFPDRFEFPIEKQR